MSDNGHLPKGRLRQWTEFEMHTLLSLICKGAHRAGLDKTEAMLKLTEKLNHAVNRPRDENDWHKDDFQMDDVAHMMALVMAEKKGAMKFIERQLPSRITRTQSRVFARDLNFTGTVEEWKGGRNMEEKDRQSLQYQEFRDRTKDKEVSHMLRMYDDEATEADKSSRCHRRPTLCPRVKENVAPKTQDSDGPIQTTENDNELNSSPAAASKDDPRPLDSTGWSGGFAQPLTEVTNMSSVPLTPNWGDAMAQYQGSPPRQQYSAHWEGEQERHLGETDATPQVDPYFTGQGLHGKGFASTNQAHPDTGLRGNSSSARSVMWGDMGGINGADERFQRGYDQPAPSLPYSSGWGIGFDNFAAGTPLPNTLDVDENDTGPPEVQAQPATSQPYSFSAHAPMATGSGGYEANPITAPSDPSYRETGSGSAPSGQEHLDASEPFVHPDRRFAGQN